MPVDPIKLTAEHKAEWVDFVADIKTWLLANDSNIQNATVVDTGESPPGPPPPPPNQ